MNQAHMEITDLDHPRPAFKEGPDLGGPFADGVGAVIDVSEAFDIGKPLCGLWAYRAGKTTSDSQRADVSLEVLGEELDRLNGKTPVHFRA